MNLDGLSLAPLVAELNAKLSGARVDKIFQPDKYTLIIWLRQPGETIPLLISANPAYPRLCQTETLPPNPPVPPVFAMLLRKHLEDGRIAKIEQHGLDRIATIHVDVRGERGLIVTKELTVEIMGKHSNIILAQDGVIIDAVRRVGITMSRFRQVLPGRQYNPPPGQAGANIMRLAAGEFTRLLRHHPDGQAALSKAIIEASTGLGPLTAREIAWRAGLPAAMPVGALDDDDASSITEAIAGLVEPLSCGNTAPTVILNADRSRLLGIAAFYPEHLANQQPLRFATMSAAVEYAANFQVKPENPEKAVLQKLLTSELAKLKRRETALCADSAEAELADELRRQADILMAHFHAVPDGAAMASLPDLYAEDPEKNTVTIALNPLLSPLENARQLYAKYNKLKRAQESLSIQLRECRQEIAYLDSISVAVDNTETFAETGEIRQELTAAGYLKDKTKRRSQAPPVPLTAQTADNTVIIVGKNNRQNDLVTFKQAHPDDLWFHAKDIPGSHVILRCNGLEPSGDSIAAAATLAAYFSKARQSTTVPVDYTRRRHVKKPAGAKPGFVIYDHQKTIHVSPDEDAVRALLDTRQK